MTEVIEELELNDADQISELRQRIRAISDQFGAGAVKQTKMVTACVEILRNSLNFAGGGTIRVERVKDGEERQPGLVFVVRDQGPGIDNLEKAMEPGWSGPESNGLGKGLSGSKNLADEFELESRPGEGTTVTLKFNL